MRSARSYRYGHCLREAHHRGAIHTSWDAVEEKCWKQILKGQGRNLDAVNDERGRWTDGKRTRYTALLSN